MRNVNAITYRRFLRRAIPLALLIVFAGLQAWRGCNVEPPQPASLPAGTYPVARVVDGDTILLADHTRLRLIGVNAPETVKPEHPVEPWGPEASEFTHGFVGNGPVRLEFDEERFDQYHRLLAYVYVDGRMLNEELLRAGLARWERGYHYSQSMKTRFRRAETEARKAHRGIWSDEGREQ